MTNNETIKIEDSKGFVYEVDIDHSPQFGFSTAYYRGRIIDQYDLHKIYPPSSDDDHEWEKYQDRFAEWRDEVLVNLKPKCKAYFDRQ